MLDLLLINDTARSHPAKIFATAIGFSSANSRRVEFDVTAMGMPTIDSGGHEATPSAFPTSWFVANWSTEIPTPRIPCDPLQFLCLCSMMAVHGGGSVDFSCLIQYIMAVRYTVVVVVI